MRSLLAALCVVLALPAWAKGGAQQFSYDSGYSFRDVIGQTYSGYYGWHNIQVVDPSRAVYMGSGSPSRFPGSTIKWTIETGDHGAGGSLERNEFADMFGTSQQDESPASGTEYYALSVYIPSGWVDPGGSTHWFVVAQLHPDDSNTGHSAVANFALLLASDLVDADHYALRTIGGPIGADGGIPAADDVVTDLGPHVYGAWVDFVFKITWASDVEGGGHVTAWKRVPSQGTAFTQMADYDAPTLYSSGGVTQTTFYWKRGIYRGDDGTQGTVIIYTGPLVRAGSFRDAATAAFGQWP